MTKSGKGESYTVVFTPMVARSHVALVHLVVALVHLLVVSELTVLVFSPFWK